MNRPTNGITEVRAGGRYGGGFPPISAGAEFEPTPHFVEIGDRQRLRHTDFSLPEDLVGKLSEARDRADARNLSVRLAGNVAKVTPADLLSYRNWKVSQLETLLTGTVRQAESGTEIEVPSVIFMSDAGAK